LKSPWLQATYYAFEPFGAHIAALEIAPQDSQLMLNRFRRLVIALFPQLAAAVRERRHRRESDENETRSSAEVFGEIYRRGLWGGGGNGFFSGSGSDREISAPFVDIAGRYIDDHGIASIVDLGCGDFRVGRQLVRPGLKYIGVDVVSDLIAENQRRYGNDFVSFEVRDIVNGPLPDGDLYLVRQVLQHMSNDQIDAVLRNLDDRQHVIIAEHHPAPDRLQRPNEDKRPGRGTRIGYRSGVFPERPPFSRAYDVIGSTATRPIASSGERIVIYAKRASAEASGADHVSGRQGAATAQA